MNDDSGTDSDAFGQALLDHHSGKAIHYCLERSDGFVYVGDLRPYFSTEEGWPELDRIALSHATGRVLDVGCGAGRHSLFLQEKGSVEVRAIDSSRGAVRLARLRGVRHVKCLRFDQIDRFRGGSIDTVLLLGGSCELLGSRRRAKLLLSAMAGVTSSGGRIVAVGFDPYRDPNPVHARYRRDNEAAGRMPGQLRVRIRYNQLKTGWIDLLHLSLAELESLLVGSKWSVVDSVSPRGYQQFMVVLAKTE